MPNITKRKRQLMDAREAKRAKLQGENPGETSASNPNVGSSVEQSATNTGPLDVSETNVDPGPSTSTSVDPTGPSTSHGDDDTPSSEDEETVDVEALIREHTEDWIENLHRDDLMSLSLVLHRLLVSDLKYPLTNAAVNIANIIERSERTVREWRTIFATNKGSFPDTLQGKYQRSGVLWHSEDLNKRATKYVRENAAVKGRPNMKLVSFVKWVNDVLLPNHALEPGYPRKVSTETARKWLHEIGFEVIDAKKGTYVDGHERADVVEYRGKFLRKMVALGFLNEDNAPTEEAKQALPTDLECPPKERLEKTVIVFHDESTFQANDYEKTQWGTKDQHMLVPKGRGAGIMVSDFITEQDGYLHLTEAEYQEGLEKYPNLKRYARASIEYGENKDGYWTSERFINQIKSVSQIAEVKYPREKGYKVVFVFDHSSCHGAYAEDALNASRMNAKPGGKQPLMHDTFWKGNPQSMVNRGVAKGLIQVLTERGRYRKGMVLQEMRDEIATHPDFKEEKTRIEYCLNNKGFACMFLPKFHCELNPIERVWAQAKRYTREHCTYSIVGLRNTVPDGLDVVTVDNIRNHYRKVRHYMFAYLLGISGGPQIEEMVKKMKKVYTSHRRVGVNE